MELLRMTDTKTRKLCQIIADKMLMSGFYPDLIVAPFRGGVVIGRYLSDILNQPEVTAIATKFYTGINETSEKVTITQELSIPVEGKNVLLIDDVSDRGNTLEACYQHIKSKQPKSLKTATLYVKPWSSFTPDYYAAQTDKWIVFIGEEYETIRKLYKKKKFKTLRKHFSQRDIRNALKILKLEPKMKG